ncbi:IclR family transcriptional regulator domain-containing protein [Croceicoccus gelatinilyticus]|uniref:IclR family transcriptional regulator domain-containing protein n=1 Tax=Croceicoccus gelatinilyticus TaxID=2835536 RepID=UPI001BD0B171|nr:helix-turn-helix domain-containing protein [Croceicoccus gelatinilyticus]MBS7669028.1 helix-turn-helix domain-containing protein [Croceicoccus gelatinilyticus]
MERGVPIRSVSRAIGVLQAVNQLGSLSMMQIAKRGNLPYPTACRIVQTLIHEGLLEQEPARKYYRPTALVQSLSQGFQADSVVVETARRHIRALTQKIGWPVSVTVRVGTQMVVRDSTHADTSLTFERYYPGFRLPLMDCASGRVCLAHMSQQELDSVMGWISLVGAPEEQEMTAYVSVNTLNKIREEGYAAIGWGQHNLTPGKTSSIAVPIFVDGKFEAALTLIYFAAAMKQGEAIERYIDDLKTCAEQISEELREGGDDYLLEAAE